MRAPVQTNCEVSMYDWMIYEETDEEMNDDAVQPGFAFNGQGYYDEEGIWHDPEVEEAYEE